MPGSIRLQERSNLRHKRVIGVGIGKEGANTEQHLAYGEGRTPLILEDVETDASIRVNVAVINAGGEMDLGGFEWIVSGEVNIKEENTTCVRGLIGSHYSCLPVEHVIPNWSG